ncbi:MAG: BREX system Lon protease-like protein BrxL [Coprobacillus sp.]|nr:BREX system Lon protease-like protein BrxL [Coprobacillus sp.]
MDNLDRKIIQNFPGKIVRKDLTELMKKGSNVPTYVLEYLLGMYCSTDDTTIIENGMNKIRNILSENYVKPDQSEYIKSKIRQNGTYTIIDKIRVTLDEREDKYVAHFTNLNVAPFEVSSDLVVNNEKILLGGIWCIAKIEYLKLDNSSTENDNIDIFGDDKLKKEKSKKRNKYESPFKIVYLKPIQMPTLDLNSMIKAREKFSKEEWIDLLIRSEGYEPNELTTIQKYHYLLRIVPFIQKNYNLVELGPRGTGKSHVFSELSPHSILISGGNTTPANMFYNLSRHSIGLVGNWDCVAFDEVGGLKNTNFEVIQTLKNYMANGSFARGTDSINADASIVFVGNTFKSIQDMLTYSTLFDPFPMTINNDSAFFDRIHAYLPGWETPKLKSSLFTHNYGLISDCLSEYCHTLRKYDFTDLFSEFYSLNGSFNTRDETAVRKTFSGLAKLIFPNEIMTKEDARELLIYAISVRKRVKNQLKKMSFTEFKDVDLGFIDNETDEEYVVDVNEQEEKSIVSSTFENPGYVYGIGRSLNGYIGIYRLENKAFSGTGKFEQKNIEGLNESYSSKIYPVKDSINAAFNYFKTNCYKIISNSYDNYDYGLFINDLQNKGLCNEISVAEVVGLCSAVVGRSVMPSLAIVGRVVASGNMLPLMTSIEEILITAETSGVKYLLLPNECSEKIEKINSSYIKNIEIIYYSTPIDAARKALGY